MLASTSEAHLMCGSLGSNQSHKNIPRHATAPYSASQVAVPAEGPFLCMFILAMEGHWWDFVWQDRNLARSQAAAVGKGAE